MNDTALGNGLEAQLAKAAIASGARLVAGIARVSAQARGELAAFEVTRDLRYGELPEQRYDVWRLRGNDSAARPLVLFLHGGGFQHLDKESHWAFAERFAQAGAVVCNIDYRLAPRHRYPAAAHDAMLAYRHIVARAEELGADERQLVVAGTSAGGNLALGMALQHDVSVKPRAAVLLSGLLQVSDMKRLYRHRRIARILRARVASIAVDYLPRGGEDPAAWARPREVDPWLDPLLELEQRATLPSDLPAMFLSSGTQDLVLEDSLRLAARLSHSECSYELDVLPGGGHSYQALTFQPRVRALWERCFAFLRRQGVQLSSARSSGAAS